jgi:hypothetical protein
MPSKAGGKSDRKTGKKAAKSLPACRKGGAGLSPLLFNATGNSTEIRTSGVSPDECLAGLSPHPGGQNLWGLVSGRQHFGIAGCIVIIPTSFRKYLIKAGF